MWHLPAEIIDIILSHFLPGLVLAVYRPNLFPWYLGQICGSWRANFISSPKFWRSFVINVHPIRRRLNQNGAKELVELCLQRSVNDPLSFSYRSYDDPDSIVLKLLVAQSTRWQDVYLDLDTHEVPIVYKAKHRFQKLRAFKLKDQVENQYHDLLQGAFQLKRVSVVDLLRWRLGWSSLTTLHLESPSHNLINILVMQADKLVDALNHIDKLEELYITGYPSMLSEEYPTITLPFLKILGTSSPLWFPMFITPVLEEIYIQRIEIGPHQLDMHLTPFFLQPLDHLRKLVLCTLSSAEMATTLEKFSDIEEISLYVNSLSLMQSLPSCPARHHLKAVLVGLDLYLPEILSNLLAIANTWSIESKAVGIGHLEALQRFTLELVGDNACTRAEFLSFEDEFVRIFKDRGVHCEVRHTGSVHREQVGVPEFEVFNARSCRSLTPFTCTLMDEEYDLH